MICADCKQEFPDKLFFVVCAPCTEKRQAEAERRQAEETQRERASEWETMCPLEMRLTDAAKLPKPAVLTEVMAWKMARRGLIIAGSPRSGKSRCAWMLLQREHMLGTRTFGITAAALMRYPLLLAHDSKKAMEFINRCLFTGILLLDDCFKVKMTERPEEALYMIIDERTMNGRPIIVTMNDSAETLKARLSPDRAEPLIARLDEFCDAITV